MKNLLSLIIGLCMVFTTIGSITVVNAENFTITETYNVARGEIYTLPAGGSVDISNPGYQIVQDTDGKWYRVNVGTYGVVMYDDMETHSTTMSTSTVGTGTTTEGSIDNATLSIDDYNITSTTANQRKSQRFESDGTNVYAAFGPDYSSWNTKWTLTKEMAVPYRLSFDMRIKGLDLSKVTKGYKSVLSVQADGANYISLFPWVNDTNSDAKLHARVFGIKLNNAGTGYEANSGTGGYIEIDAETSVDENSVFSSEWFNVEILVKSDYTYSIFVNGKEVVTDYTNKTLTGLGFLESMGGLNTVAFALRSADVYTETLVDNVKVTDNVIVYPSVINGEGLNDSVYSGVKSGRVSVPVTMSDNTIQNFTANYTLTDAQTAAVGTYNVEATIPGFSEKVTVAVSVKDSAAANKTINTYRNAKVIFPTTIDSLSVKWKDYDGESVTTADTSAIGRKYYTGNIADGRTVTYTVNIGEYNLKLEDKMSTHTNTTNEDGLNTINPGAWDGFTLEMVNNTTDKNSATVGSDFAGNKYLQVSEKTPADNAKWLVKDSFNGDYKVSYDIKIENADINKASYFPYRFIVADTKGKMIGSAALYVSTDKKLYMRGNKYSGSLSSTDVTSLSGWSVTNSIGNMEDWATVEILVHTEEQTFDIIFEGTTTHSGLPFLANDYYGAGTTDGTLGAVSFDRRQVATVTDKDGKTTATTAATAMIDNVEIYTYNCFTEELAEAIDVVTPVGKSTVEIPLVLSNGGVKNFTMMLPCDVSKIARFDNLDAEIVGFDGNIKANIKVANYQINGVNLKSGSEFVTAPVAGGAVESVNIKKLTDAAAQAAIFVLYSQNDDIKAIKTVDISSLKKDEESVIAVNMALPENTTKGDYIRVYVWNSKEILQPLDLITDLTFDYDAAPDVYVAAASMYQTYSRTEIPSQWPKMGIGQALSDYVRDNVSVINLAKSGAATHTFINDGLWNRILANVKTGDYVIVAFGGNDQVKCTDETHPDGCVFKTNIRYFIESVRAKGANPIISTPAARRLEGINGAPAFDRTSHKHLTTAKQIADDSDVPFIDLTTLTMNYLQSLDNKETESVNEALDASKKLYMVDLVDNMNNYQSHALWANSRYNPSGSVKDTNYTTDNSHFTSYGAKIYAKILATELAKLNNNLSKFIVNTDITITYPALD